jgi:hypothetical protein
MRQLELEGFEPPRGAVCGTCRRCRRLCVGPYVRPLGLRIGLFSADERGLILCFAPATVGAVRGHLSQVLTVVAWPAT